MCADINETEHCWVAMPDGTRLSSRIWWPAGTGPFPAIIEYIPYRKRDMVRARDERNHPWFARHGYVCLRVDMRGSGDSEGDMPDMYADAELADARQVIEWIASQSWSNGKVGMFGTSWGGTASLQAAIDAPGPLKAVLANCATTNRFEDDIHWMGGGLLTDSFEWGVTLPAILAAPPDAATVGDNWEAIWKSRLDNLAFPLEAWVKNATRGHYWRHGSVQSSADRISCPVLSIGGWSDRYSNSVISLVQERPDICWGVVGPWGHHYPDQGEPGPAISFQKLALTWWDAWLKDDGQGMTNLPRLRIWRRQYEDPQDRVVQRKGEWLQTENTLERIGCKFYIGSEGLLLQAGQDVYSFTIPNDIRHGECAGDTGYFGRIGGLPLEQSPDDERSLCLDSAPLDTDLDLIGHAEFECKLLRDQTRAQVVCRLCEVKPDGSSNLVTRQILELSLDPALDKVMPSSPDETRRYTIRFPSTAYRFSKGNCVRLALATTYWPLVWPSSTTVTMQLLSHEARLVLPLLADLQPLANAFPDVEPIPENPSWQAESKGTLKRARATEDKGFLTSSWQNPSLTISYPAQSIAITMSTSAAYSAELTGDNCTSLEMEHKITIHRPDGKAQIESSLASKTDYKTMYLESRLTVCWNSVIVLDKQDRINVKL